VKEKKNKIISMRGELVELTGPALREGKQQFWNEMLWYIRVQGWSAGRAAHTYKDKFGVWPRGLKEDTPCMPSDNTRRFVDKKLKQFFRTIGK
jgi:hypothetical protein